LSSYSYDSAGRMLTMSNPLGKTATISYDSAGQATGITRPDQMPQAVNAIQMDNLSGGNLNSASPMLTVEAQAIFTDENNNLWQWSLDSLGFGTTSQAQDPLTGMNLHYRDTNGLAWLSSDPLAHRTRRFFDSLANPTTVVQPDDTTQQYSYNSFSERTVAVDPLGNGTTTSYDSVGNRTQIQDALTHDLHQPGPSRHEHGRAGPHHEL